MKHIDIYLDTFPESGGLMPQIAAYNKKPIISLKDDDMPLADSSEIVKPDYNHFIVSNSLQEYDIKLRNLIENSNNRLMYGQGAYNGLYTKKDFNNNLLEILNLKSKMAYNLYDISTLQVENLYYERENYFLRRYRRINNNKYAKRRLFRYCFDMIIGFANKFFR